MAIPRMRTAEQVLEEIRKLDPETAISLHYVRQLIKADVVPVLCIGRKKLVNVDDVIAYLESGISVTVATPVEHGKIRRIV